LEVEYFEKHCDLLKASSIEGIIISYIRLNTSPPCSISDCTTYKARLSLKSSISGLKAKPKHAITGFLPSFSSNLRALFLSPLRKHSKPKKFLLAIFPSFSIS